MAQRKKSEIEFIQDTFCPQVAVLCSYDAEVVCRKNALTFVELVQPFCRFSGEIKITDVSNNIFTISNLRVEIKDINQIPAPPLTLKKILDDTVLNGLSSSQNIEKHIQNTNYDFTADLNTPWFEAWREYFIKIGQPGDHEFLKNFISCILVVSTGHLDPLDQFQKLILQLQQFQTTQSTTNRNSKWFFPNLTNIYKYFVLLHDVHEGEISKAHQIYENLKSLYGSSNCHLLQINSKSSQSAVNSAQSATADPFTMKQQQQSVTVEFDPWLQYIKFNDLYNSSQTTAVGVMLENDENLDSNKLNNHDDLLVNSIPHPLNESNYLDNDSELGKQLKGPNSNGTSLNSNQKRHGTGMCLAMSDHDRIKTFISEFLQRGLVPYAERIIKILNEQIQSKKSIIKSLNFPRRIFGGGASSNSSTSSSSKSSTNANLITVSTAGLSNSNNSSNSSNGASILTITNNFIQTNDDFQLRRLADLAFMFRLYDLAYNSYYSCKKEFLNVVASNSSSDGILSMKMFYAGALEMASISNFMQNFATATTDTQSSTASGSLPTSISAQSLSSISSSTSSNKSYNFQFIEEAIQLYYNECKSIYFATRCVLLSTEALKASHLNQKAASQFFSLATDDTDIRSALFLEQAALCYLAQQPLSWVRKYAFFMSLAGHRYNKVGQKKHSLRAYKHALEIYDDKQWFKAQDHINFMMSRLSYNLKNIRDALNHVGNIIVKNRQPRKHHHHKHHNQNHLIEFANELNILKDFILYCNILNRELITGQSENGTSNHLLPILNLPSVDSSSIVVNLNPTDNSSIKYGLVLANNENSADSIQNIENSFDKSSIKNFIETSLKTSAEIREMWQKFEEVLYVKTFGNLSVLFKPQINNLTSFTDNKHMPKVVVNEWVSVTFNLLNSLRVNMTLCDITLLWKFVEQQPQHSHHQQSDSATVNDNIVEITNEHNHSLSKDIAECSIINELILAPSDSCRIRLKLKVKKPHGHLHILGIKYKFSLAENAKIQASLLEKDFIVGKQLFELRGPRLNNNQQSMRSVVYDVDNRLNLKIVNKTPLMNVEFDHLPTNLVCNQLERVKIYFVNTSTEASIGNIKIASNGLAMSRIFFNDLNKSRTNGNGIFEANTQLKTLNKSDFKYKENLVSQEENQNNNESTQSKFQKISELNEELVYSVDNVTIAPNGRYCLDMWIRAPDSEGEQKFYFMFFYQELISAQNVELTTSSANDSAKLLKRKLSASQNLKYRTLRYEFSVKTVHSLSVTNSSILNSSIDSNLLLNLELTNKNFYSTFELIDIISVSDMWTVNSTESINGFLLKPIYDSNSTLTRNKSTTSIDSLQIQIQQQKATQNNKSNQDVLSLVLIAEPVLKKKTKTNEKIYLFKSSINSVAASSLSKKMASSANNDNLHLDDQHPDENVLFNFIFNDLKNQLLETSVRSSYLNLNIICKSKIVTKENEEATQQYCILPVSLIENLIPTSSISFMYRNPEKHEKLVPVTTMALSKTVQNLVTISVHCEPVYKIALNKNRISSIDVEILLKNLSDHNDHDLALFAKNACNQDSERCYLWLGCNKKYIKLKSSQSKEIKFKLGFISNGVYEIGKLSNENQFKMSILDASSIATTSSLDDDLIMDNDIRGELVINNSKSQQQLVNDSSAAIFVYIKNNATNRYEFFRKLSHFTVIIMNDAE